ncbi:cytochrome d ubiquinol oxidase subunit II [Segetibacter aerophilus]|uniref:Uncharacterized protein n=1 Tax=Segetibacter aerophilus TaxID=670293 RepID=A0A512BIJ3_9BACT|nr:cytochrome d ubiquinol oxidase subunit II [Segetibacter aerophilus]GEO11637.1 hypothetical protein SAE01_41330 [Segetibacter aerophilus]
MRRYPFLVIALALFSLIDGYLLSAISFVGRAGISLFYTQYQFLKSWWKGALLVFIVWIILLVIQSWIGNKVSRATSKVLQISLLIIAIAGLYLSYADFRNSLSHRWLGERFHLGVYLFWLGWITISIFMLLQRKVDRIEDAKTDNVTDRTMGKS